MTDIATIGTQLVDYCRQGQTDQAIAQLYAEDIVSIEARAAFGPQRVQGLAAIHEKNERFESNMEVHEARAEGPFPHGDDRFAVFFDYDLTNKQSGDRMRLQEVAVYTVKNGKIAQEEFFYTE